MRSAISIRTLGAALALTAGGSAAFAATADVWARSTPPNGAFSVETPCTASEIDALKNLPGDAMPMKVEPDARLVCKKGKILFFAGQAAVGALPAGVTSIFDKIADGVTADTGAEGEPRTLTIDGHRALINRDDSEGPMAQTGIIEVDARTIIVLVAGVEQGSDISLVDQGKMIDRFYGSIRVIAK